MALAMMMRVPPCCGRDCLSKFTPDQLESWRTSFLATDLKMQNFFLYQELRRFKRDHPDRFDYHIRSKAVCKGAFRSIYGISRDRLHRLAKHLRQGNTDPPPGKRVGRIRATHTNNSPHGVDAFFFDQWSNAGEPLPEDEDGQETTIPSNSILKDTDVIQNGPQVLPEVMGRRFIELRPLNMFYEDL